MNALGSRTAAQSSYLLDVARAKSWGVKVKHALPAAMLLNSQQEMESLVSSTFNLLGTQEKKNKKRKKS